MTAADVTRLAETVREQDHSIRAVSDTVIDVKTTVDQHTGQLSAIQRALVQHGRALGALQDGQVNTERRLDAVEGRLGGVEGRLETVDGRLVALERGQDSLREGQDSLRQLVTEVLRRLDAH